MTVQRSQPNNERRCIRRVVIWSVSIILVSLLMIWAGRNELVFLYYTRFF